MTMFRMLASFKLRPGIAADDFCRALAELTAHMKGRDLLLATGPVGRRQRHPVMDTDDERDQEYFFIMSFADRAQCDRAVEYLYRHEDPVESIHRSVYGKISDPVFVCWEDLPGQGA